MSHLETSNADSAQSKDVWNENLEFLRSSADCLQNPNEPFRDYYLRLTTSDIWWVGGTQPLLPSRPPCGAFVWRSYKEIKSSPKTGCVLPPHSVAFMAPGATEDAELAETMETYF